MLEATLRGALADRRDEQIVRDEQLYDLVKYAVNAGIHGKG